MKTIKSQIENPSGVFGELHITPEDASLIIASYEYPRQRDKRQEWALELGLLAEDGKLLPTMLHFAHCDGAVYLIDGYHRLTGVSVAKVEAGVTFPVQHHYCGTMDDVDEVYGKIDQGMPRSIGAVIKAQQLDAKWGVAKHVINKAAAAAKLISTDFLEVKMAQQGRSSTRRLEKVESWLDEVRLYEAAIEGGVKHITSRLHRSGVMSVGLVIMKHRPDEGQEFFRSISRMATTERSGASALLAKLTDPGYDNDRPGAWARITANAWNAFYEGREISRAFVTDPLRAIEIKGTPYTGPKRIVAEPRKKGTVPRRRNR